MCTLILRPKQFIFPVEFKHTLSYSTFIPTKDNNNFKYCNHIYRPPGCGWFLNELLTSLGFGRYLSGFCASVWSPLRLFLTKINFLRFTSPGVFSPGSSQCCRWPPLQPVGSWFLGQRWHRRRYGKGSRSPAQTQIEHHSQDVQLMRNSAVSWGCSHSECNFIQSLKREKKKHSIGGINEAALQEFQEVLCCDDNYMNQEDYHYGQLHFCSHARLRQSEAVERRTKRERHRKEEEERADIPWHCFPFPAVARQQCEIFKRPITNQ